VATVREVLRPSPADVAQAEAVLAAAEQAGGGVFRWQGMMVDEPVLAAARAVLADAGPTSAG
jgi:citrate lyase subunit beta/citryl-CoA lyase